MHPRLGIPTGFRAADEDADPDSADELSTLTYHSSKILYPNVYLKIRSSVWIIRILIAGAFIPS